MTLQVGSRLIWQILGVTLMACGVLGKFGAFMAMIPDPVIGTTVCLLPPEVSPAHDAGRRKSSDIVGRTHHPCQNEYQKHTINESEVAVNTLLGRLEENISTFCLDGQPTSAMLRSRGAEMRLGLTSGFLINLDISY